MEIRTNKAGRKVLANLFKGTGVELGVERGKYSLEILKTCDKLYCVDLWSSYGDYRTHVSQEEYDAIYEDCKRRLAKYDVGYIRAESGAASLIVEDESLDFIYIDAAHDKISVLRDLNIWVSKVKKGGIVAGHDYKRTKNFGVIEALNEYCNKNGIKELTVWTGDSSPSWHFIKE